MKIVVSLGATLAAAVLATSAGASAPPVGPLPKGPVTAIRVEHGQLFALVLPKPASGYTWRGARNTNVKVAKPLHEGELKGNIVLVYKALKAGKTKIAYALTRGETEKAYQSQAFQVTVT
jgi:predicted secreted protein